MLRRKPDAAEITNGPPVARGRFRWKKEFTYLLLMAAALLLMVLLIIFLQKPTNVEEYIRHSGYAGVFLLGLIGSASPIWPFPGSWAVFIAAGLGLNPFLLALACGFGEPLGELMGYLAGYGGQAVARKFRMYHRVEGWMKKRGTLTIFLASAIPNPVIKLATAAAGALNYPVWKFFLACWGGKTIKSLGFAFAGWGLFTGIKRMLGF